LKEIGIGGEILAWIQDWLKGRKQRVVLLGKSSKWTDVMSGVPQGSVLGPILFLIYINDVDEVVAGKILKFADDTKLFDTIRNHVDSFRMQCDLDNLCHWSELWLMPFNVAKCKVMHLGHNNLNAEYYLNKQILQVVSEERDLGIIIQDDLKCSGQCAKAVKSANRILGMIRRTFTYLTRDVFISLYKSMVCPHLEYCVQAWRPHLVKDIMMLEAVQRRATKLIPNMQHMSYEERLKILNLTTLETRRLRGDLIEVFKMVKGMENINYEIFFEKSISNTRGHDHKFFKPACRLDARKYFFSHRVVDIWNGLQTELVDCGTVNSFKNMLDKYMEGRGFI
jgi:hypothetical protein